MMKVQFTFSNNLELVYNLHNTASAEFFANSIQQLTPADICPTTFKSGFDCESLIPEKIKRFYHVANSINLMYPNQVNILPLEPDWRLALQQMHTHFPDLTNNLPGPELAKASPLLGEFNDLIHWLEKELGRKLTKSLLDKSWATICLDFNRAPTCCHMPLPVNDYQYFTHQVYFGNLHLHYDNVGRHPWELFGNQDYICPADQALSQTQISPSCNMYFNDWDILRQRRQSMSLTDYNAKFEQFYHARGGKEFFKYDLNDPKLAVGYLKIGELANLSDYTSVDFRNQLRNQLSTSTIIGWQIY
jgi:hypothetical protein